MLPKDGEGGHWETNPEDLTRQVWIPDEDEEDYEYDEPIGREVDIGGGLCTNAPSAFLDENAEHVINWKDETIVWEYVNRMYKKTQAVLNSAVIANNWSDEEIEETIDDVIKLSKGVYQKYVLTEVSEYISRPEEDIIKFISNFIIRWGPAVFDHNGQFRQMIKDFACKGTNYGESYEDYAARVREAYRRKRSASS